ncbi:MAG: FG-GAP repeat protein [Nannocystales bacterium]
MPRPRPTTTPLTPFRTAKALVADQDPSGHNVSASTAKRTRRPSSAYESRAPLLMLSLCLSTTGCFNPDDAPAADGVGESSTGMATTSGVVSTSGSSTTRSSTTLPSTTPPADTTGSTSGGTELSETTTASDETTTGAPAVLCGEDEFVASGVCLMCPEATWNEAGDDAAGPDTVCDDACSEVLGVTCDVYEQGYVKASNTDEEDTFGFSVAISGDTLAVSAPEEASGGTGVNPDAQDDNTAGQAGAVYVFTRANGEWSQQAYLKADNSDAGDRFGESIALFGDTLAVGAPYEGSGSGGVSPQGSADNSASGSGAVYIFERSAETWTQQAYVKASNTGAGDRFGVSVALSGDTLLVGAPREDGATTGVNPADQGNNSASSAGAAYVFERVGVTWVQQAYLKASNADAGDRFGSLVALFGDTLAVSAWAEDSAAVGVNPDGEDDNSTSNAGAVYVFERSDATWSQQAYLKASNTDENDEFGSSVALSGDTLAVGAWGEASATTGVDGDQSDNSLVLAGAVYVYQRVAGAWSQQAYIKSDNPRDGDSFGEYGLALSDDILAVGAWREDSAATGLNGDATNDFAPQAGAAYLYRRMRETWSPLAYIKAENTNSGDAFGRFFALSDGTLVVGAPGEDSDATGVDGDASDNSADDAGAAYLYQVAP